MKKIDIMIQLSYHKEKWENLNLGDLRKMKHKELEALYKRCL